MKINRRLNLVIPVEREDHSPMYVHATPVSAEVFDAYFLPIAKTFSTIYSSGLGPFGGPRVADKLLRKVAQDMGVWEGQGGVKQGLMTEIRRLTNVLMPQERGWQMVPYDDAVSKGYIDSQDASEIEAALVFFTVASLMHRRTEVGEILGSAMSLWGARTELLACTEFMSSLPTWIPGESSGEPVT